MLTFTMFMLSGKRRVVEFSGAVPEIGMESINNYGEDVVYMTRKQAETFQTMLDLGMKENAEIGIDYKIY